LINYRNLLFSVDFYSFETFLKLLLFFSSTSLQLSWRPPPITSLNGEFLGYYVTYRPRHSNVSNLVSEAFINDPEVNQFLIKGLSPFTQYLVSHLKCFNLDLRISSSSLSFVQSGNDSFGNGNPLFQEKEMFAILINPIQSFTNKLWNRGKGNERRLQNVALISMN
jgi:hypothetical protein